MVFIFKISRKLKLLSNFLLRSLYFLCLNWFFGVYYLKNYNEYYSNLTCVNKIVFCFRSLADIGKVHSSSKSKYMFNQLCTLIFLYLLQGGVNELKEFALQLKQLQISWKYKHIFGISNTLIIIVLYSVFSILMDLYLLNRAILIFK